MFICQVFCSGIQGIYIQFTGGGGPSVKVDSSAKVGAVVFNPSLLFYPGDPSDKVISSAMFGVVVFKASLLY